jgi:23S rRNA (guanosine2251-2'-O)-methyltransferase
MDRCVIGKNCVQELLNHAPYRIVSVFTAFGSDDPLIKRLLEEKKPVYEVSRKKLDDLCSSTSHQGYVVETTKRETVSLQDLIDPSKPQSLIVVLDSIFDPQNVGAILRACECFGVDGVIYSKNKGCKITPTVTKTSVGATEIIPLVEVSNLTTTVEKLQKNGYWVISSQISSTATSLYDFTFPNKTVLILGSEGVGVQQILSRKADFHLYIPMLGKIDSLNVSQAAAVFLHQFQYSFSKQS